MAGWVADPLSEKLSEKGKAFTSFFIFLLTYSRKYSLSKILILFELIDISYICYLVLGAFHAGDRGSNPLGDATLNIYLTSLFNAVFTDYISENGIFGFKGEKSIPPKFPPYGHKKGPRFPRSLSRLWPVYFFCPRPGKSAITTHILAGWFNNSGLSFAHF